MVILAPNLVMNRNVSVCVCMSVSVRVCVFLSLCVHLHMSVGVGGGDAEPVVRKESLQTITVLLLSARAAGWGFLSDRWGVWGILATASFCTHFLSLENGVSRAWK